jgi:Domain of unknown function (DUF4410)
MKTLQTTPCALVSVVLCLVLAQACSTPTKNKTVSSALPRPGAKVLVGTITNQTGKTFDFPVEQEFHAALARELQKKDLLAAATPGPGDFVLNLDIADFRPGDPFKRWVLPGWGCTVLAINGGLWEQDGRKLVAEIDHQRTVAAGGFFTVGAEHYILNDVAHDLASDLNLRIAQGGDFVVNAKSRADVVRAIEPGADSRTICLAEVNDRRSETGRIGERQAAFGASMGDVYFSRSVEGYMRENLELELTAAGCRLGNTNTATKLVCNVNKFSIRTHTTPLYWDVIAEMNITVSNLTQSPPQQEELSATATKRTYVWPTASLCGKVLDESMNKLMAQFRDAKVWR